MRAADDGPGQTSLSTPPSASCSACAAESDIPFTADALETPWVCRRHADDFRGRMLLMSSHNTDDAVLRRHFRLGRCTMGQRLYRRRRGVIYVTPYQHAPSIERDISRAAWHLLSNDIFRQSSRHLLSRASLHSGRPLYHHCCQSVTRAVAQRPMSVSAISGGHDMGLLGRLRTRRPLSYDFPCA